MPPAPPEGYRARRVRPTFLVKSVLRFGAVSDFGVPRVAVAAYTVPHGLVPERLPKTCERRSPTLCSASDAATKTYVGPTSTNGGLVASQPPEQKNMRPTQPKDQILKLPAEGIRCTNPVPHRENAMSRTTFTFRVEEDLKENFASIAKSMDRTGAQLLRDCMRDLVRRQQEAEEHDAWFCKQVRTGLDSANAGNLVPHETVEEKLPLAEPKPAASSIF